MSKSEALRELRLIQKKIAYLSENPDNSLLIRDLITKAIRILRYHQLHTKNDELPRDIDLILSSLRYDLVSLDDYRLNNYTERKRNALFQHTMHNLRGNFLVLVSASSPILSCY